MAATITWTWTCDICGAEKTESQGKLFMGSHIASCNDLPYRWSYISDKLVCPDHVVLIDPKDER